MSAKLFSAALAAALLCANGALAADAQDCALKQIASLPITTTASGKIAVPVKVNGADHLFLVSLQSPFSAVTEDFATRVRLPTSDKPGPIAEGIVTSAFRTATVSDLQIGVLDLKDKSVPVLLYASGLDGADGVLGYGLLSQFDVELDFAKGNLNLYSHDHCPGKVVYWASAYAVTPLRIEPFPKMAGEMITGGMLYNLGGVVTQATLDGKPLTVGLSLEPGMGLMALDAASRAMSIPEDTLKATRYSPDAEFAFGSYRYPFATLSIGRVAIANPDIVLYPKSACPVSFVQAGDLGNGTHRYCIADLWLRMSELRKLHLYFAFKEQKLYVTAADAHK